MSCHSVESVLSNADIVMEIYKNLNLQSQLRLCRVNSELATVFQSLVWTEKYKNLNISEKGWNFIVSNETDGNRLNMNCAELQEFLNVYALGVNKIQLRNIILDVERYGYMANEITHGHMILRNQLNIRQFKHLKSLSYHFMTIPLDHMRLVAKLYPDLEELSLTNCSIGNDIYAILYEILPQLKKLKHLCLKDFLRFRVPFSKFQELVHEGHLETLQVSAALEPGECLQGVDVNFQPPGNLKELHIEATFEPHKWQHNFALYLRYFESLTNLDLEVSEKITDETLEVLAFACNELKQLNLRYSTFDNVKQIVMPPKLRELSLNWCRGLSHSNLQQMLTRLHITKFISTDTAYRDEFTSFKVSPFIKCLLVDSVFTQDFQFNAAQNDLKDLTWYHPWSTVDTSNSITLDACPTLEKLNIQEGYLELNTLRHLRSLKTLSIPHPVPLLTWSYLTQLLTHPSLENLAIRCFNSYFYRYQRMTVGVPSQAIVTGIKELEIPLDICDLALRFWLELFCVNKPLRRLSCTFYPNERYDEFLVQLVNHAQFPKAVRCIDVCGFTINCKQFRTHPAEYLEKLHNQTDNTKCCRDNDVYRIIIQKNC